LNNVISEVSKHYLERALQKTHGQKTAAARVLGFNNYQTLKNWAKKYNIHS
jgi:DNA-binding protein Fis